ncbi:hypothetical protein SynA1560_01634 [Synechococcus sp. A15-60]|nr:hypothetical protein SynA1560_01634 [Synechococcus sp. A15-60]
MGSTRLALQQAIPRDTAKKSPVEDEGFEWCEELVFHQPPSV